MANPVARTGEHADERLMRKADGTVLWCHVAGKAVDSARQKLLT